MDKTHKRIESITLEEIIDDNPDISYLGEIKNTPSHRHKNEAWIPVDPEAPDGEWFSPCNHLPHKKENWDNTPDDIKQNVITKYGSLRKADIAYAYADLKRLQDLYSGRWWMIGLKVTALIAISEDGKHWAHESIFESMWGIESDSGDDYKKEIVTDLMATVKQSLIEWGFSEEEINEVQLS